MLLHKTRFITPSLDSYGGALIDTEIDQILQGDLKDEASSKFAKLVAINLTPTAIGNGFFLTIIAER